MHETSSSQKRRFRQNLDVRDKNSVLLKVGVLALAASHCPVSVHARLTPHPCMSV